MSSLLAGTTQGVYRGTRAAAGQDLIIWKKIGTNLPQGVAVTQVHVTPTGLFAVTPFHGLWRLSHSAGDSGAWQLAEAAQWLAGQSLPGIGGSLASSVEFVAAVTGTESVTYLFPFQVLCAGELSVSTSPPNQPVTLVRLRPNLTVVPLPWAGFGERLLCCGNDRRVSGGSHNHRLRSVEIKSGGLQSCRNSRRNVHWAGGELRSDAGWQDQSRRQASRPPPRRAQSRRKTLQRTDQCCSGRCAACALRCPSRWRRHTHPGFRRSGSWSQ